jgi:predicted MPP superfamily phosphohydrolase
MFLLVLIFVILVQATFVFALISHDNPLVIGIGIAYFSVFVVSLVLVFKSFRNGNSSDYKKGFYAFGMAILSSVPSIGFFVPGILGIITGIHWLTMVGFGVAAMLFLAIIVGMIFGRWNWKVHRVSLEFENLPASMDGIKLVQISDVHVGSFFNQHHRVMKAIHKINSLNADYVLFTGDLVNNTVREMEGWEHVFQQIQAERGKYSILGNHDYGDYVRWSSEEKKQSNLDSLIEMHKTIGFTPLLNQSIELDTDFWLLGVENWGKAPFRQSGDLKKALEGIPENSFKLMLSHDPSHFDEQIVPDSSIELTLSGHTHGMQFGIERFGIRFSPVSFRYKKWAGLYQEGEQFLYVNRGFGYLGFPGRVGIYPEITEIVLKRKG